MTTKARRSTGWWATKLAWTVLAIIAVVVLAIGSSHPPPTPAAARISHLDSIVRCPACEDLSIAQSDAPSSLSLRREVRREVLAGWSDQRIEAHVVARFGSGALLTPSPGGVSTTLYLVPVGLIGIAVLLLGRFLWRRRPEALRRDEDDDDVSGTDYASGTLPPDPWDRLGQRP